MNRLTLWILAIGCGVSVANLYYIQPLLAMVAAQFHVSPGTTGIAATLTQVGYAIGMLTIVPLGDMLERRSLVTLVTFTSAVMLFVVGVSPSFGLLAVGSLALGVSTATPQLLVPFAATLAAPEQRGRVVGFVMSGLLIGILLARTASGMMAAHFGWRSIYFVAAAMVTVLAITLRLVLPKSRPTHTEGYGPLLKSLGRLVVEEPVLRQSALFGACLFASFSAFWTSLSFLLAGPTFHMGPEVVGRFGLIGAAGALAAPLVGRFTDRGSPRTAVLAGFVLALISFLIFGLSAASVFGLIVGVVLMDVGVQGGHISNQSRVFALRPEFRSRMNTIYMTSYFVGGSLGSALSAQAWTRSGWAGVCMVGSGFLTVGLLGFMLTRRR